MAGMILCGTTFRTPFQPELAAAAAIAHELEAALVLATVLPHDEPALRRSAGERLEERAAEIRSELGVEVQTRVAVGQPETELLKLASALGARLLVVGSPDGLTEHRPLGSLCEHLCQRAEIPVLVVRRSTPFSSWLRDEAPLRALLGSGLGDASKSALACIGNWPRVEVTVTHVAWTYGEHYRLGVGDRQPPERLAPDVYQQLLGDLGYWATEVPCRVPPKLRVLAGGRRADEHLAEVAHEQEVDLVVVGTHERNHEPSVWKASTSLSVLRSAPCNVLAVPERFLPVRSARAPQVVVVPTDFSPLADRAIPLAASLLQRGGMLHVVHVAAGSPSASAELAREVEARLPKDASLRGISCEARVLDGAEPWLGIWRYAERKRADFICMSRHSRARAPGELLGAQTKALLEHSKLPVILVPSDRES
jgi:nucleotide-binding universal stress UspA family protein